MKELLIGRPHPVDGSGAYNLLSYVIDFSAEQVIIFFLYNYILVPIGGRTTPAAQVHP